ncbi:MAG: hypothetical protein M3164_07000 [Actinomycetota bacterium]|nr:hypothetical protein [Actinomycetota bacterium]
MSEELREPVSASGGRVPSSGQPPQADSRPSPHPSAADWRYAAAVVVLTRLVFLPVGYLAHWFFSPARGAPTGSALEIWRRWDADILLRIATFGYVPEADPHPTAFFPAFPLLVRAVSVTSVSPVIAGLAINAAACLVAFAYLSHLAGRDLGSEDAGKRAVLYLAFFPTAVFLVAPYTEPVFLAGAIAAFSYARSGRWGWSALPAALAVGARVMGIALLAGLVVELLRQKGLTRRKAAAAIGALVVGALPLVLYAFYLWRTRGNPVYFLVDQRLGWGRSFVGPVESFRATIDGSKWSGASTGFFIAMRLEVAAAVLGIAFTIWAAVRREFGYATFMGVTLAALVTSSWYFSIPRVLLSLFPIPILVAAFTQKGRVRHDLVLASFATIAAFGTVAFVRGVWFF